MLKLDVISPSGFTPISKPYISLWSRAFLSGSGLALGLTGFLAMMGRVGAEGKHYALRESVRVGGKHAYSPVKKQSGPAA